MLAPLQAPMKEGAVVAAVAAAVILEEKVRRMTKTKKTTTEKKTLLKVMMGIVVAEMTVVCSHVENVLHSVSCEATIQLDASSHEVHPVAAVGHHHA